MPSSGMYRWRRKRAPRKIRSKPAKMELRCGCLGSSPLLTRPSRTDVPFARGHSLADENDAGNDQQDRPKFSDAETRILAEEKKYTDGDQHHGTHQSADPAIGAGAACFEAGRHPIA